jgi:hypothetical protein
MLVPLRGIGRWTSDVLVSGLQSTVSLPRSPIFSRKRKISSGIINARAFHTKFDGESGEEKTIVF